MVLSDLGVDDDGSLQPEDSGGDLGTLFGREGNLLLVNGKIRPTLKARPGRPQRWRIINAAKARYFQIDLPGHTFARSGGDGGLLSAPIQVKNPVLAPGERADLVVVPTGNEGDDLVARWVVYDRGFGTAFNRPPVDLFVIHLEGSAVTPPASPPSIHRTIEPIPTEGATCPSTVRFTS
jgi:FtsP/CotA-like multicopper oxidase with cupredoxin domain